MWDYVTVILQQVSGQFSFTKTFYCVVKLFWNCSLSYKELVNSSSKINLAFTLVRFRLNMPFYVMFFFLLLYYYRYEIFLQHTDYRVDMNLFTKSVLYSIYSVCSAFAVRMSNTYTLRIRHAPLCFHKYNVCSVVLVRFFCGIQWVTVGNSQYLDD